VLFSEIIAVCSQIHIKHINTLCGQNVELLNVKLLLHIVTTRLLKSFMCVGCIGGGGRVAPQAVGMR